MLVCLLACQLGASELEYIIEIHSVKVTVENIDCAGIGPVQLKFDASNSVPFPGFELGAPTTLELSQAQFDEIKGSIAPELVFDGEEHPISVIVSRSFDIEVCFKNLELTVNGEAASVTVEEQCNLSAPVLYFLQQDGAEISLTLVNATTFQTAAFSLNGWQSSNVYFLAISGPNQAQFMNLIVKKHSTRLSRDVRIYWNDDHVLIGLGLFKFHEEINSTGLTELEIVYHQELANYQSLTFKKEIMDINVEWDAIIAFGDGDEEFASYTSLLLPYGMLYLNYKNGSQTVSYSEYCDVVVTSVKDIMLGIGNNRLELQVYAFKDLDITQCTMVLVAGEWESDKIQATSLELPPIHTVSNAYSAESFEISVETAKSFYQSAVQRKGKSLAAIDCPTLLYYVETVYSLKSVNLYPFIGISVALCAILAPILWIYFFYLPKKLEKQQLERLNEELKRREEEERRYALEGIPKQNLFYKGIDDEVETKKIFSDIETVNGIQNSGRSRMNPGSDALRSINEAENGMYLEAIGQDEAEIDAEFEELERELDEMKDGGLEDYDIE